MYHAVTSISTKTTTELLEKDSVPFVYPHTIELKNLTTFTSEEFLVWRKNQGVVRPTGAPYNPTTIEATERLAQSS